MSNLFPTVTENKSANILKKRLAELRKELYSIIERRNKLSEKIDETLDTLSRENVSTESMYEELLQEISLLEDKMNVRGEEKYRSANPSESKKKKGEKKNLDAKKLYRKISAICHPDKTDDAELHEIYIEAQKAYDNDDAEQLYYIYSTLIQEEKVDVKNKEDEQKELMMAIDALNRKIIEETKEYAMVKHSPGYEIHVNMSSDKITSNMRARHQYSELLYRKIENAAAKKEELESKITENENNL